MTIRYKMIAGERLEDAPFVGALISSIDCKFNCKNCFNQKIKELTTLTSKPDDIIEQIKKDPFNKGVILAGLEWTLQIDEAIAIADRAKTNDLKVMLYTGNTFDKIDSSVREHFDYIKCGQYDENLRTINHIEYGVTLASSNQHIYKKGKDY